MNETSLFLRFGVATVIGVLVGLQREYAYDNRDHEIPAGVRTYALMGLLGCSASMLSETFNSPLPIAAVLLIMGAFSVVIYARDCSAGKVGLTTRVSALLMIVIGALCYQDNLALPVALGVVTTVLLSIKLETHELVTHVTREDIVATLKFAIITAIVLPLLPNQVYGPAMFNIFNPFKIWLFVVFISTVSLVGYLLVKVTGPQKGIGLTGIFGGIASSTAVTFSFTDRSIENPELSKSFALAILLAWSIMFIRLIGVVAPFNVAMVPHIALPLSISAAVGLIYCFYLYRRQKTDHSEGLSFNNPFKLGPAIKFGLIFVLILFVAKAAQYYFGSTGVYISSIFSGLADVDAIAFSMAKLASGSDGISVVVASKAVVIAALANTCLKGGIIFFWGAPALKRDVFPGFVLMSLSAALSVIFF